MLTLLTRMVVLFPDDVEVLASCGRVIFALQLALWARTSCGLFSDLQFVRVRTIFDRLIPNVSALDPPRRR